MRMHRGSSKDGEANGLPSETLPLSASPSPVDVEVEIARAGRSEVRREVVAGGTRVRDLLRRIGLAPEGCAVLVGDVSIPLDSPLERPVHLVVVPTFSGG